MRKLAGRIVWIYTAIMVAVFFILTYPILLLFLIHPKLYPLAHGYRKVWGWFLILVCGLWPRVTRQSRLSRRKKYVFVPNHSSYLDIVSCACLLPGTFSFMAKQELRNVPLFGIFFRTIDIAVDRKSNSASHRAFVEAGKRLAQGMNILIFPEGTIPSHTPQLGRFKIGAFRLAIEQGAEIVPVSIPDNFRRLPDGTFMAFPGLMRMTIHRPLPTAHLNPSDAEDLKEEVYRIIEEALIKQGAIPPQNV